MERLNERAATARCLLSSLLCIYNETVAEEIYAGLAAYARLLDTWLSAITQRIQP